MATWEDGPEYAPMERPSQFDVPEVAPLETAPPSAPPGPNAPDERPRFDGPSAAVTPLTQLVPEPTEAQRDPHVPFDVAASTITSTEGAWGAVHWSGPAAWGPPEGPAAGNWPAPTQTAPVVPAGNWPAPDAATLGTSGPSSSAPGASASTVPPGWPAPTDPVSLQSGPPTNASGFAVTGSVQWFASGQPMVQPAAPGGEPTPGNVVKAMTPGVLICLLITVILPLAPICFVIAFALSSRIKVARSQVLRAFTVTAVAVFVLTVIIFALSQNPDASFYSTLSLLTLLGSLALAVIVAVLVRSGLKKSGVPGPGPGQGYPPYTGSPWG